jgi:hypothetical protein
MDRGREVRFSRTPLPPNRTGGFPAYGSLVGSSRMGLSETIVGRPQTKETRFRKVIIWPALLTGEAFRVVPMTAKQ